MVRRGDSSKHLNRKVEGFVSTCTAGMDIMRKITRWYER
jgi:hypothetical protein